MDLTLRLWAAQLESRGKIPAKEFQDKLDKYNGKKESKSKPQKPLKYLFIALFLLGCFFSTPLVAAILTGDWRYAWNNRRVLTIIAIGIWFLMLILATNTLL